MAKGMSKILGLELENFMSIKEAKLVFDETNIINLKGYNDSGKSAITRALDVLLFDSYKRAQKNFITHGEHYFRIKLHFDDGVTIVRDKYLNGSSLYEMYSEGSLIFSTKVGNTLTQVKDVPLEIKEYLAMTETSQGNYLNSQSIYDKQFLIQTSGSENVELLNGVLKLKETGLATTAIKNDINQLSSSINGILADIEAIKTSLERYEDLDEGFILLLSDLDSKYDEVERKYNRLAELEDLLVDISELPKGVPELSMVDGSLYSSLLGVAESVEELAKIKEIPNVDKIDYNSYLDLLKLWELQNSYKNVDTLILDIPLIDFGMLNSLKILGNSFEELVEISNIISSLSGRAEELENESSEIQEYARENGISISKCDNCGALVQGVAGHVHL